MTRAAIDRVLQWPQGRLDFFGGCLIMGILNITPDSFSDGGRFLDSERAVERGLQMVEEGAAIVDVGGESTRPGSEAVSRAEQVRRVVPVIESLVRQIDVPISIDTCNVEVARAALDAGATMLNDITALSDESVANLAAEWQVPVVLMHMQGTPKTMQAEPHYDDVVGEVLHFLLERAGHAESLGIPSERILIDPGIGFGKTAEHNLKLLKHVARFVGTNYRVLVGASRKRFIGTVTGKNKPDDRSFGTAAITALCAAAGVSVVRVHDVAATCDVLRMVHAIQDS